MSVPLAAARVSVVREYQAGPWALNSPMKMLSPRNVVEKEVKNGHGIGRTGGVRGM